MKFRLGLFLLLIPPTVQAQLMDPGLQARLDASLPTLSNVIADDALHGRLPGKRLFYTGNEIPHASQDHDGSLSTSWFLSSHNRSANKDGLPGTDFETPWKNPGGTDQSYTYTYKVMFLPSGTKIVVHRTRLTSFFSGQNGNAFFGRGNLENVSGYGWTFPDGTRFFEVLNFGDRLQAFEVRARTKIDGRWRVNLYRPFPTRESFVEAVNSAGDPSMSAWVFDTKTAHRNKAAVAVRSKVDSVPGFADKAQLAKAMDRTFRSALNRGWTEECSAPTTTSDLAIVPKNYAGWIVGNTAESCVNCHKDAATHVRFFDANREWYGFVRGEKKEQILSFHPASLGSLSGNGTRTRFALNQRLVEAGMIAWRD